MTIYKKKKKKKKVLIKTCSISVGVQFVIKDIPVEGHSSNSLITWWGPLVDTMIRLITFPREVGLKPI